MLHRPRTGDGEPTAAPPQPPPRAPRPAAPVSPARLEGGVQRLRHRAATLLPAMVASLFVVVPSVAIIALEISDIFAESAATTPWYKERYGKRGARGDTRLADVYRGVQCAFLLVAAVLAAGRAVVLRGTWNGGPTTRRSSRPQDHTAAEDTATGAPGATGATGATGAPDATDAPDADGADGATGATSAAPVGMLRACIAGWGRAAEATTTVLAVISSELKRFKEFKAAFRVAACVGVIQAIVQAGLAVPLCAGVREWGTHHWMLVRVLQFLLADAALAVATSKVFPILGGKGGGGKTGDNAVVSVTTGGGGDAPPARLGGRRLFLVERFGWLIFSLIVLRCLKPLADHLVAK